MTLKELFKESKELKRLIYRRSREHNIPIAHVCHDIGIDYWGFMKKHFNATDKTTFEISEEQILKLFEVYGIKIRYTFVIDDSVDMVKTRVRLNHNYKENKKELARQHVKKKRIAAGAE